MAGEDSYGLDPKFERAISALLCLDRTFFLRVGHAIESDALDAPEAKLLVQACKVIAAERSNVGPGSTLVVIQRLQRWRVEGRVTQEEIADCDDYLTEAEDAGLPMIEDAIAELAPVIRRRKEKEAVRIAMDRYAKRGDMQDVVKHLQASRSIGEIDTRQGTALGSAESLMHIAAIRGLARLPTGITELDAELSGGPPRKTLSVVMGGTGDGKSMFLNHVAATSTLNGLFVCVATLELPEPYVHARLIANMTGIPIDEIIDGSVPETLIQTRLQELRERGRLGLCLIGEFTPKLTKVIDLTRWIKYEEDRAGRKCDLFVCDYADKLGHEDRGEYKGMDSVYEGLRIYSVEEDCWVWTASQSKRKDKKSKQRQDIDDVADSIGKGRVSDLWISLQNNDGNVEYLVSKNRLGKGRKIVGPLPAEFECGRMAPVIDDEHDEDFDVPF